MPGWWLQARRLTCSRPHAAARWRAPPGSTPTYTSWRGEPGRGERRGAARGAPRARARTSASTSSARRRAGRARRRSSAQRWAEIVPPVVVAWDGDARWCRSRCRRELDDDWELEVTTEAGARDPRAAAGCSSCRPTRTRGRAASCTASGARRLSLDGELGYHTLRWQLRRASGEAFVIAAPTQAWGAPGQRRASAGACSRRSTASRRRASRRGRRSRRRCARLFERGRRARRRVRRDAAAPRGVPRRAVRVLAVLAGEPAVLERALPRSRARSPPSSGSRAPVGAADRRRALIDYRAQYAWRRAASSTRSRDACFADPDRARRDRRVGDRARRLRLRRVSRARRGRSARAGARGPRRSRDGTPLVRTRDAGDRARRRAARASTRTSFAQWAMQRQLEALRGGAGRALPRSARRRELRRLRGLAVARAVPDRRSPPARRPTRCSSAARTGACRRCRRSRCAAIATATSSAACATTCSVAGMLRIDHVMGLFRLYCVPRGPARRPTASTCATRADELLAILTLESTRARVRARRRGPRHRARRTCARRWRAHGLFRLHVGQWGLPDDVGRRPRRRRRPSRSRASTRTTPPTFAGWWRGADIDDKRDLGLIDADQDAAERVEREHAARRAARVRAGARVTTSTLDRGRARDGRGRRAISPPGPPRSCSSRSTISRSIRSRTTFPARRPSGRTGSAASSAGRTRSIPSAHRPPRPPRSRRSSPPADGPRTTEPRGTGAAPPCGKESPIWPNRRPPLAPGSSRSARSS